MSPRNSVWKLANLGKPADDDLERLSAIVS